MTQTPGRFAYRCLPLVIANSHGWELLVDQSFAATWSGSSSPQEMQVCFLDEKRSLLPASHFGQGVLTFQVGYLFETEDRNNLWVMGPINKPKDGIIPLCGVVEADWGPYTFTMNWMFTRPGTVRFEKGEPFCHIFPIPRQLLSAVQPEIRDLAEAPKKAEDLASWRTARGAVLDRVRKGEIEPTNQVFGMHYFTGETPNGQVVVPDHVTRLTLKPFQDRTSRKVLRPAEAGPRPKITSPSNVEAPAGAKAGAPCEERLVRAHFMSNGSHGSTVAFPDPFYSASLACEGCLDKAVQRAVMPLWLRLRQVREGGQCYLWFQRKRAHLAIHLHGPEDEASELRRWLEDAGAGSSPVLDAYRRSDASLGDGELLFDHRYAGLASLCLARGCDFVLTSLNGENEVAPGTRRTILLRALLAGLSALGLPLEMRFSYLIYHRDSVLREAMSHGNQSGALPKAVASLDTKAEASTEPLQRLRGILAINWNGRVDPQAAPAELGAWQLSLGRLCKYFGASHHRDRWAAEPAFVPLFKACHGVANQVGMASLDEAFLCHLLVRARPPATTSIFVSDRDQSDPVLGGSLPQR